MAFPHGVTIAVGVSASTRVVSESRLSAFNADQVTQQEQEVTLLQVLQSRPHVRPGIGRLGGH